MSGFKPLVLVVLDGWGCYAQTTHNAIASAHTPNWDRWQQEYPFLQLQASGEAVGLPAGQMGNSEVGHLHIGAGRVVNQELTRINKAIEHGEFANNPVLIDLIQDLKKTGKALHLMGLLSDGGVHSHQEHLFAILQCCQQHQLPEVLVHVFLDGRDCAPKSAVGSLQRLDACLKNHPGARVASVSGRYFAMDRNKNWDRTRLVYELLTQAESPYQFDSASACVNYFYAENVFDEFIPPSLIGAKKPIASGDSVFFFNFRADRARQLTQVLLDDSFTAFERNQRPMLTALVSMTQYADALRTRVMFAPESLPNMLGAVLAEHGLRQLRIAETEKYAHVTYFFNGGVETPSMNEDRRLIASPAVATYDRCPEMSAVEITQEVVKQIQDKAYDVIICNYANADMVGHTGDFAATVKAIECLDHCLATVAEAVLAQGGGLLITADHGNAEQMFDVKSKQPHTAHTSGPVPFLFIGKGWHNTQVTGSLIDVAPTVLTLLNIPVPPEMTGRALLIKDRLAENNAD